MTKTGRNEPCPCGSGKKYKRCCGSPENREHALAESRQESISPAEYDNALDHLLDYFDGFMDVDGEAEELFKQAAWFDLLYEPGTERGVPEGLFLPWLHFDLPFGESELTLSERFMRSSAFKNLSGATVEALRRMSASYASFYRTVDVKPDYLAFREFGTGREWRVVAEEEDEDVFVVGDVQYMRLLGPPANAHMFDFPWLLEGDRMEAIEGFYEEQWRQAKADVEDTTTEEEVFVRFNKHLSSFIYPVD